MRGDNALAYGGNSGEGENTKAQDMVSKVRVDYFLRMREGKRKLRRTPRFLVQETDWLMISLTKIGQTRVRASWGIMTRVIKS